MVASCLASGRWTLGYLVVLLTVHAWMATSDRADAFAAWTSTNVVNLGTHPVGALVGRAGV